MILSKQQAKKLDYPMTLDLREQKAREYLQTKIGVKWVVRYYFIEAFAIVGIILFWLALFAFFFMEADAKEPKITYDNLYIEGTDKKPPFKIYHQLKDECYAQEVNDKTHCIKTGLSIAYAESSWKDHHTPFGLQSKDKSYKKWVSSYKKYWHTATDWFFFYGDWGKLGRSHYCTSEESSGSSKGCPNGKLNFESIYFSLKF